MRVHDPSTVVTERRTDFCLSTGRGVNVLKREGRGDWAYAGSIFPQDGFPEWHDREIPGNRGHLWAPDVIKVGKKWLVYYSVSTFGKNHSAIGLASGTTLDPESRKFEWKDEGIVIRSRAGDRFNAIDPALVMDGDRLWMSFGSFWDGIMMVELDPATGMRKDPEARPIHLARHAEIEAPFIHKEDGWYYLFVNWGKCCRGVESTYEIRVGRSRGIEGPYVDRDGTKLTDGGGTGVMTTDGKFIGPGHASIFVEKGQQWLVHHFYDGDDRGRSKLRMVPLEWKEGWPVVAEP